MQWDIRQYGAVVINGIKMTIMKKMKHRKQDFTSLEAIVQAVFIDILFFRLKAMIIVLAVMQGYNKMQIF